MQGAEKSGRRPFAVLVAAHDSISMTEKAIHVCISPFSRQVTEWCRGLFLFAVEEDSADIELTGMDFERQRAHMSEGDSIFLRGRPAGADMIPP